MRIRLVHCKVGPTLVAIIIEGQGSTTLSNTTLSITTQNHDIQNNNKKRDTQHNYIQHNGSFIMLNVANNPIMLSVIRLKVEAPSAEVSAFEKHPSLSDSKDFYKICSRFC